MSSVQEGKASDEREEKGGAPAEAAASPPPANHKPIKRMVCIGDVHGNTKEFKALWKELLAELGENELRKAAVVFLGDLCDRGLCMHTRKNAVAKPIDCCAPRSYVGRAHLCWHVPRCVGPDTKGMLDLIIALRDERAKSDDAGPFGEY